MHAVFLCHGVSMGRKAAPAGTAIRGTGTMKTAMAPAIKNAGTGRVGVGAARHPKTASGPAEQRSAEILDHEGFTCSKFVEQM